MIQFTLDELMEIHGVMTSHYCDPEQSTKVNENLMCTLVALIEDATALIKPPEPITSLEILEK